jgi:tyrosyl-tRNA synthetase
MIERELAHSHSVENNVAKLTSATEKFFKRAFDYASSRLSVDATHYSRPEILNNLAWYENMSMLRFLRDVGSVSRVNTMLARER